MRDEREGWKEEGRVGEWGEDAFIKGKVTWHFGEKCGCGLVFEGFGH